MKRKANPALLKFPVIKRPRILQTPVFSPFDGMIKNQHCSPLITRLGK